MTSIEYCKCAFSSRFLELCIFFEEYAAYLINICGAAHTRPERKVGQIGSIGFIVCGRVGQTISVINRLIRTYWLGKKMNSNNEADNVRDMKPRQIYGMPTISETRRCPSKRYLGDFTRSSLSLSLSLFTHSMIFKRSCSRALLKKVPREPIA